MKATFKAVAALSAVLMLALTGIAKAELAAGDQAPDFELLDQNSKTHKLSDYAGQWVVLYFYPKDDTPGCTEEACRFRDDIAAIRKLGGVVLGVSMDTVESHIAFAQKHGLPFSLLADPEGKVADLYGTKTKFGNMTVAARHTFIVNPESKIAKVYREVDPKAHAAEVIADITALAGKGS
jgi:peroxiredoxin Q/BCP